MKSPACTCLFPLLLALLPAATIAAQSHHTGQHKFDNAEQCSNSQFKTCNCSVVDLPSG